jgi:hypothetical protein
MGRLPRTLLLAAITFSITLPCRAVATDETLPDPGTLAQMEAQALQAKPRDQCFLYTELVHKLTELAGHQMLAGDSSGADTTLHQVQHYAALIHLGLANNTKRLMNAQMLMHHTTLKLDGYVHKASFEDRGPMEATLKQLTQVEGELLNQVFSH